jgi:DNA-binding NarL/FixJ family response regulator
MALPKHRVFFLDDDIAFLEIIDTFYKEEGVNISTFCSWASLLLHLDENPDLIVLDYIFPDGHPNGADIVSSLKEKLPTVPIIILSAQQNPKVIHQLFDAGIEDYIVKDASFYHELSQSISRLREKHFRVN